MQEILNQTYGGNSLLTYISIVLFVIIGVIALRLIKRIVIKRLEQFSKRTQTSLDDFLISIVNRVVVPLLNVGIFYLALKMLRFGSRFARGVNIAGMALMTFFIAKFAALFAEYGFRVYCRKRGSDEAFMHSLRGIIRMVKFLIWALAVVFFLDNLGFEVTAVIAGLGVGGVAVALAAQAVLGDLFSYLAILFDRPFEIGDFIIIGDYMGVVEHVGIKTTRISSLGGEQLIFSNSDLTNSRVRNYKRMQKRRVVFKFGVVYQTSLDTVKQIPDLIKAIITNIEDTIFDRAHFFAYGDSSLTFEVVYYVQGADYNKYMDIQQEINFAIKKTFEDKGIEFAYPTQTVYVTQQ
jgi:small-conductance mechanosensitive channel